MEINHIASGSSGNAILVGDGYSRLLLDCGISHKKIAQQVKPSSLAAVLLTHEHMDHAKAAPELIRRGVTVTMSEGTFQSLSKKKKGRSTESIMPFNPIINRAEHLQQFRANSWMVLPFDVEHDAAEPMGFLFQSRQTGEKGVYISDSAFVNYNFTGVTHWIIEANYEEEILESGQYEDWLKDRVRRSHFSIDDLIKFFEDSDLSATEEIHLVHLSIANSNEQEFKKKLQARTGIPVYSISDNETKESIP